MWECLWSYYSQTGSRYIQEKELKERQKNHYRLSTKDKSGLPKEQTEDEKEMMEQGIVSQK